MSTPPKPCSCGTDLRPSTATEIALAQRDAALASVRALLRSFPEWRKQHSTTAQQIALLDAQTMLAEAGIVL